MVYMKKADVIKYMSDTFGSAYSNPQLPVKTLYGVDFYSTIHVEGLFSSKRLWREMESKVTSYLDI